MAGRVLKQWSDQVKAQKALLEQGASWGQIVNFASIDLGSQVYGLLSGQDEGHMM